MIASDLKFLVTDLYKEISTKDGSVFKFSDFGWRHTAYMVRKSGIGQFHYARWYELIWAGDTTVVCKLNDLFRHNSGILRFVTFKINKKKDLYLNRSSFYKSIREYSATETSKQDFMTDFSI